MALINLVDAKTGEALVAKIDHDIVPDLTQALLQAVDKLVADLKGLKVTITINVS